jgi:hypothetical protein
MKYYYAPEDPKPAPLNIVSVIRTYREERGLDFATARDLAIDEFRKRGWPVPESIARLYGRPNPVI